MKEFRAFILRGNVVDLAVGVVMGAAFGTVVTSLVKDLLTPLLGVLGSPDFSELKVPIGRATLTYGNFINSIVSFFLIGFGVFFFVVKPVNRLMELRKPEMPLEHVTKACQHCLSSIPAGATVCMFCTRDV